MIGNVRKLNRFACFALLATQLSALSVSALPLRGIVTDSIGNRQSGATVEFFDPMQGIQIYSIQADAAGYFEFADITEMEYQIRVTTQSYPLQWFSWYGNTVYRQYRTRIGIATIPDTLYILTVPNPVDNPPNNKLTILLADSAGGTLANPGVHYVALYRSEDYCELPGVNNGNSGVLFDTLQAGRYAVLIRSPEYPMQFHHPDRNTSRPEYFLNIGGGLATTQTVRLYPTPTGDGGFRGICLSETDAVLPGITVSVCQTYDTFKVVYSQTTGSDGIFIFDSIMESDFFLKFEGIGYPLQWYSLRRTETTRYPENPVWSMHVPYDTMRIRLSTNPVDNPATGSLSVAVMDSAGTIDVSAGTVELIDVASGVIYAPGMDTVTKRFHAVNIPAGQYYIRLNFSPYPTQYYSSSGNTLTPMQFINISISSSLHFDVILQKTPGQTGTVTGYGVVRGSVKDSAGSPVGDATVIVYDRNFIPLRSTGTTMDGQFYLSGVPAGTVFIGMKSALFQLQYWMSPGMTFVQSAAAAITLNSIDTLTVNAVLTRSGSSSQPTDTAASGSGGIIRGKVTDITSGAPIIGVRIILVEYLPQSGINPRYLWSPWTAYTDASGSYTLSNITTGSYLVLAEADSLNYIAQFYPKSDLAANAKVLSVSPASSNVADFFLRKGGIARGSVVNSSGAAVADARVNLSSASARYFDVMTGSDGYYTISAIPGGVWNVWVDHPEYIMLDNTVKREFSISEGSTTSLPAIVMEKGGRVSGSFTSSLPLNDSSGVNRMYQGSLLLFSDSVRPSGSLVWPVYMTGVMFETPTSPGYSGLFRSDAIKAGNYRMIFTPFSSFDPDTSAYATTPRQGFGYSFVGSGTSYGTASVVRISANDTTGNQVLNLRKGWTLPGRLKDENGAIPASGGGVEVFVKQDSLFIRMSYAPVMPDGRFELAGILENEDYFLMLQASGYPSQFWGASVSTATPETAYRFTPGSFQPLELTIRRSVSGMDTGKSSPSPISLRIENDSAGLPMLSWSTDPALQYDNLILYSGDQLGGVAQLATFSRSAASSVSKYRDLRTSLKNRDYVIVAKGAAQIVRSERIGYDPRNSSAAAAGLWLDVVTDRRGIRLEWGGGKALSFTSQDSVNVFRAIGNDAPQLLFRVSAWQSSGDDYKWSRSDSGRTFTYYIELPSKQLKSSSVSKTLDAAFFAGLAMKLAVGPYEKFQRISDAVAVAADFDIIEVRSGTYYENINFAGKNISINGSWDYGKPPVIDGGGSVAITVPYCKKGRDWDRPRISGFLIRNCSNGIKSQSAIDVEECLFDNVTVALSMTIDSMAMVQQLLYNPFRSNSIDGFLRHCTFIAGKSGNMIAAATAVGTAELPGYTGQFSGREQFYISPALSLTSQISVEQSIAAFYQSRALQTTLPVTVQGNSSRVRFSRCDFWKTSTTLRASGTEIADNAAIVDPQFSDSTWWFIAATSPLAGTTYDTRLGYDVRLLYKGGPSDGGLRPSAVRNLKAETVGLTTVLLRWDAAPATDKVTRYRVYRVPGDPSLFYINQESQWDLKLPQDSMFSVIDSFSTDKTVFMDTSVVPGKPYLYVVAALDGDGNESEISIPAPPDISTYFVNQPADRIALSAGNWHMIGTQGGLPFSLSADSRHALFDWDGSRVPDKTLANYGRASELQPTKGYWFKPAVDTVLTMSSASFDALKPIEASASVRLTKGVNGWNLVASPFTFAASPDWLGTYAAWEWNADSPGYRKATRLRPWMAYWIYTDRDTTLQLIKKQPLSYYASNPLAKAAAAEPLWQLRISLQSAHSWDSDNFLGVMPDVLAKSRLLTSPEPPAAFDGAQLYIIDQTPGTETATPQHFAQLFKTAARSNAKLEWIIGMGAAATASTLSFEGIGTLPDNLYAFWVEQNRVVNLREQASIEIPAHASETSGFLVVTAHPGDLALYSGKLALLSPYPNPFAGSATIEYLLPYTWTGGKAANGGKLPLTLTLYTITGKRIATLVNERRGPGVYRTVWNGENGSGRQTAAGMYLMRLTYGENVRTTRLYRMK